MNSKIFLLIVFTIFLVGCSKKPETTQLTDETQMALNQTVATQTELKLMQDNETATAGGTASSQQVTAGQPSQGVTVMPTSSSSDLPLTDPTVQEMQQALKNANLYQGKIDGDLGPKTKAAVKDFQEKNNLKADGKVGPKTWAKLQPFLNAQLGTAQEPHD